MFRNQKPTPFPNCDGLHACAAAIRHNPHSTTATTMAISEQTIPAQFRAAMSEATRPIAPDASRRVVRLVGIFRLLVGARAAGRVAGLPGHPAARRAVARPVPRRLPLAYSALAAIFVLLPEALPDTGRLPRAAAARDRHRRDRHARAHGRRHHERHRRPAGGLRRRRRPDAAGPARLPRGGARDARRARRADARILAAARQRERLHRRRRARRGHLRHRRRGLPPGAPAGGKRGAGAPARHRPGQPRAAQRVHRPATCARASSWWMRPTTSG